MLSSPLKRNRGLSKAGIKPERGSSVHTVCDCRADMAELHSLEAKFRWIEQRHRVL